VHEARGYCIGPNAINARGVAVRAVDPEAAAWSLYGALSPSGLRWSRS
jgi:hypothetical protein